MIGGLCLDIMDELSGNNAVDMAHARQAHGIIAGWDHYQGSIVFRRVEVADSMGGARDSLGA